MEEVIKNIPESLPPALELRNIKQSYLNEKTNTNTVIFEDFNLLIPDYTDIGQFAVIMGKSGSGKSTLLRYWTGLQKPTSGEVFIHGKPLDASMNIPMVFQQYSSLKGDTVLENVSLPLRLKGVPVKEANEKARAIIKVVGLEGHEDKFAKIPQLSGGQLQRVAIARCLIANPSMMFLDEPYGALDSSTRTKMQFLLLDIFRNSEIAQLNPTVVLVTHDPREAVLLGQDIYILDSGKIVKHIRPDLPKEFDKSIKRDQKYLEIVGYIEDVLEGNIK